MTQVTRITWLNIIRRQYLADETTTEEFIQLVDWIFDADISDLPVPSHIGLAEWVPSERKVC